MSQRPSLGVVAELFKPVTWFPPMWAFACGVVASGVPLQGKWPLAVIGVALAGPLVCATSQAVNDWYDRHVDAINEPNRPIPSGRMWAVGLVHSSDLDAGFVGSRYFARAVGIWRSDGGPAAGLGLQRATRALERKRLVGQRGLRF